MEWEEIKRTHTTSIVWHICLAMGKQAQMGGLWIYYFLSQKFSVGAVWKIGFIQLRGLVKVFWLPRIHNYNLNGNWARAATVNIVCAYKRS
jgi:hypothetical protein